MRFKQYLYKLGLINEMSRVCNKRDGLGIIIEVYSSDHNPPHAHVFDLDKKKLGQFLITKNIPNKPEDITSYRYELSNEVKKKIVQWAIKNTEFGLNNWAVLNQTWKNFQDAKE